MKKLLLSLMVLASLASCGKNNEVSSGAGVGSSAITLNDSVAQQLGSYIDNSATMFGNSPAGYTGLTWNQILAGTYYQPAKNLTYKYAITTAQTPSSNCEVKWSIFYVCSSSSSTNTGSVTVSRSVLHSDVNVEVKRNDLKGIINSAAAGTIQFQNSVYCIRNASTGVMYTIDLRLPLQANPSAIQQTNGQVEYFSHAQ